MNKLVSMSYLESQFLHEAVLFAVIEARCRCTEYLKLFNSAVLPELKEEYFEHYKLYREKLIKFESLLKSVTL